MSKPNKRRVRMDKFLEQVNEQVLPADALVPIDVAKDVAVWIKIPLVPTEDDDYMERVQAATGDEELALIVLGEHPDHTAEEQWETWQAAGYTAKDLALVFGTESAAARERLGNFRYAG